MRPTRSTLFVRFSDAWCAASQRRGVLSTVHGHLGGGVLVSVVVISRCRTSTHFDAPASLCSSRASPTSFPVLVCVVPRFQCTGVAAHAFAASRRRPRPTVFNPSKPPPLSKSPVPRRARAPEPSPQHRRGAGRSHRRSASFPGRSGRFRENRHGTAALSSIFQTSNSAGLRVAVRCPGCVQCASVFARPAPRRCGALWTGLPHDAPPDSGRSFQRLATASTCAACSSGHPRSCTVPYCRFPAYAQRCHGRTRDLAPKTNENGRF